MQLKQFSYSGISSGWLSCMTPVYFRSTPYISHPLRTWRTPGTCSSHGNSKAQERRSNHSKYIGSHCFCIISAKTSLVKVTQPSPKSGREKVHTLPLVGRNEKSYGRFGYQEGMRIWEPWFRLPQMAGGGGRDKLKKELVRMRPE